MLTSLFLSMIHANRPVSDSSVYIFFRPIRRDNNILCACHKTTTTVYATSFKRFLVPIASYFFRFHPVENSLKQTAKRPRDMKTISAVPNMRSTSDTPRRPYLRPLTMYVMGFRSVSW